MIPSRGLKVAGLLGPAAPTDKKGTNVADTSVGIGGTTQWKLAGLVRKPTFSTGTTSPSGCAISCCAACYPGPASSSEFKTLQSYWLVKSPKYSKVNALANGKQCVQVTVHHGL